MERSTRQFEVVYTSLEAPDNASDGAVIVGRARAAIVDSRYVKNAPAPVFFSATGDSGSFAMRSSSREALATLPQSYGSVMGHFGVFERSDVSVVTDVRTAPLLSA